MFICASVHLLLPLETYYWSVYVGMVSKGGNRTNARGLNTKKLNYNSKHEANVWVVIMYLAKGQN